MDETLSTNFCPFRSPSWQSLHDPEGSLESANRLWEGILPVILPTAILCVGNLPFREISRVLKKCGRSRQAEPETIPTGWGRVSVRCHIFEYKGREVKVIGLPHLSRFAIFNREASGELEEKLRKELNEAIR